MRTELYSLRSSAEEISYVNDNLRSIVTTLNKSANIKILFKTEIDRNPKKLKADLMESYHSDNPPELQIFVNALDTKDDSSFIGLFIPFITAVEKDILKTAPAEYKRTKLVPHINVHTIDNLPGDYPAFCFAVKRRKFLVLPRISLVGSELTDYVCQVLEVAKEVFYNAAKDCPNGYIYKPKNGKNNSGISDILEEESFLTPKNITDILAETPNKAFEETYIEPSEDDEIPTDAPEQVFTPLEDTQDILYIANGDAVIDHGTVELSESEPNQTEENATEGLKGFLKKIFPVKGDPKKEIIRKFAFLLGILVFLTGAFLLLKFYVIDPAANNADMSEIQNIFYSQSNEDTAQESTQDSASTRNWAGLQKVNKEIVGWIKIDKTKVDYPVLWHKGDNQESQYYIYRNYKKEYSDFGSIFVDYRCTEGPLGRHVVLHGHNMGSDDSMFGSLLKYAYKDGWTQGNTEHYKSAPIISFDTPTAEGEWIIFGVMKINVSNENKTIFNYMQTEFESDSQYMNFIYNIKARSYLSVDIPINEDDRLLTLSTCSYERENMRTVVVARKIRDGEDITKYVSQAKKATPQNSVYSTFKEEYEAGNISWYDGKGKLNDSGSLEFLKPTETYTVTFVDGNGNVYDKQTVIKGEDAKKPVGNPPAPPSSGGYYYRFKGWSGSFKNVKKNLTIKASYDKLPIENYTPETKPPQTEATKPTETTTPATEPPATQPPTTSPPIAESTAPTSVTTTPVTEATNPSVQADPQEN